MTYFAYVIGRDGNIEGTQKRSLDQTDELAALWENAKRKEGRLIDNSPFRCVKCGEVVYWKNPVLKDPHFSHVANSNCSLRKTGSKHQHQRIQNALYRIGHNIGEHEAKVEFFDEDDQGRPRFYDVVWPIRKIAWEVDLTTNSKAEQQIRKKVRAKRNDFKMVSLVCSKKIKKQRIQDHSIPTVVVRALSENVENGGLRLEDSVVHRIMRLRENKKNLGFCFVGSCTFLNFVNSMGDYNYGRYTGINNGKRWGWARKKDIEVLENYSQKIEEIKMIKTVLFKLDGKLEVLYRKKKEIEFEYGELNKLTITVSHFRSDKLAEIRASLSSMPKNINLQIIRSILNPIILKADDIVSVSAIKLYFFPFKRKSLLAKLLNTVAESEKRIISGIEKNRNTLIDLESDLYASKEIVCKLKEKLNAARLEIQYILEYVNDANENRCC